MSYPEIMTGVAIGGQDPETNLLGGASALWIRLTLLLSRESKTLCACVIVASSSNFSCVASLTWCWLRLFNKHEK